MRMTIDVAGDKAVDRQLVGLERVMSDWTDAWPAVEDVVLAETEKQFASEGKYGSGGWLELSDSWLAYKAGAGLSMQIGTATGDLRKSLTVKDAHDGLRVHAPGEFLFGSLVSYLPHFTKVRPAVQLPESGRQGIQRALTRHAMITVQNA